MIPEETNKPKMINRRPDLEAKKLMTTVLNTFHKTEILPLAYNKLLEGKLKGWDDPKNLLELRKALVASVKKGMLERKDQEEEIALLAAVIWYCRLSDERRRELIGEWG